MMDLSALRQEYANQEHDVATTAECPYEQFQRWFDQAVQAQLIEPNAMVLATVDDQQRPSQRTVLLKYFDRHGLVFFTNYGSRKAIQMTSNPQVTVLFPWYGLHRQVEISGAVVRVSSAESLKYFATRPRGSQLGAWVSQQSQVVSNRSILEAKWEELKRRFGEGPIPLPSFWGGYRIEPWRFEFWQGGSRRLHDRIEYRLSDNSSAWQRVRLAP
ncbi:MAG: pyridoxamine 5'-phosphate oxidase [Pirellulaceae bacterium]|nr:pyridoxamine 5'-phosphate oxidase [Pirellulaceae bacterium]